MHPEQPRPLPVIELPGEYCPRCSAKLLSHRCKLLCPRCGYFMSCSEFD